MADRELLSCVSLIHEYYVSLEAPASDALRQVFDSYDLSLGNKKHFRRKIKRSVYYEEMSMSKQLDSLSTELFNLAFRYSGSQREQLFAVADATLKVATQLSIKESRSWHRVFNYAPELYGNC